ncbi:sensor histidine kinase [Polaribacter pectinis]|uniref:histidine kinase n=1 Tax=Polaribacter pectinis TaxID=2738844 RepID=A0A7G9LCE4_9FLAO|nr:sensor histidine kinase [Polaribacter pectinis]QNM86293.1 sensor histidine kinase [Polaribacter pectinis]
MLDKTSKYLKKLQFIIFIICSFSYGQTSKLDSAYYYFNKAKQFDYQNKHFRAYENYIKSLKLYEKINEIDSVAKCNIVLFELIESQNDLNKNSKPYLDAYYTYALQKKDTLFILKSYNRYAQIYWNRDTIAKSRNYYNKFLKLANSKNFIKYKAGVYSNLAFLYTKKKPDSSTFYYEKTLKYKNQLSDFQLLGTYINFAVFLKSQKKYYEAIQQLKKAEQLNTGNYKLKYNKVIYRNFANYYSLVNNHKKALHYYKKYNAVRDSLNNTQQNIAISDLDKKYQTAEKENQILQLEKDNLETEAKRIKNRNMLIGSLLFILLAGTIGILSLKNSKRKQKLAEQEKELETQKNLTLLKEQELTTINAMVDGQEKERKRIAEDLHDNLGSVLATLKLHFENLKINSEKKKIDQETLFNKTEGLIDEAYLKVRRIAHAKNAGVIANQGLLTAVKMMAEKISSADKIKIDVVDFGLNERVENSLEISVFRIIQELITNIIKHAEAKNATVNISLYDKNLNIIIEDNGKGFNINKVNLKKGMGINSIKTRVEHLKGTFEIDSTIGKGSSVIINIPVE